MREVATSTKIILEFGANHNGKIDNAYKMIDDALNLGVWGIKLQKRDLSLLEYGAKYIPRKLENSFGENYYEHRKALEFTNEQIEELKKYAEDNGLQVMVTAFDTSSVKSMIAIDVKYIKIPSQLLGNYEMNRLLIKAKEEKEYLKTVCSTGMHTINEVLEWQYINEFDIVMYCKSIYPANVNDINLVNFRILQDGLDNCIGYSSHDLKGFAISCAVCLGAQYIERHYTLDKTMKGSDHSTVSSDFEEMKKIIEDVRYAEEIMGTPEYDELKADDEKRIKRVYRKI